MGAGSENERDQLNKGMKRINNIYDGIISIENLLLADKKARKGKAHRKDVKQHDKQRGCNILTLHNALAEQTFHTSNYTTFPVWEPKERLVYCLPYYPDRIVQHSVMNKLEAVTTDLNLLNPAMEHAADRYRCRVHTSKQIKQWH